MKMEGFKLVHFSRPFKSLKRYMKGFTQGHEVRCLENCGAGTLMLCHSTCSKTKVLVLPDSTCIH